MGILSEVVDLDLLEGRLGVGRRFGPSLGLGSEPLSFPDFGLLDFVLWEIFFTVDGSDKASGFPGFFFRGRV